MSRPPSRNERPPGQPAAGAGRAQDAGFADDTAPSGSAGDTGSAAHAGHAGDAGSTAHAGRAGHTPDAASAAHTAHGGKDGRRTAGEAEGAPPVDAAPDLRAARRQVRKTLPLRVEAVRQLRRRRTWIAFGILLALPWVLAAAFEIGGAPSNNEGNTPGLVVVATKGALNFTMFTLFASTGFLLVVAVALFCGDTVASEAGWASLRYLLAAPVPRGRLLRQKLIVALAYAALAVVTLPAMAMITGIYVFGWARLRLPPGDVALPNGTALLRLLIIVGYVLASELVVAALAFLLSVTTDSPLGAVGGAVGLVIVSDIIDAVTALGHWREFLPTHWAFAWTDALQPHVEWTGMIKGSVLSASYALVLIALAVRRFRRKDIVS